MSESLSARQVRQLLVRISQRSELHRIALQMAGASRGLKSAVTFDDGAPYVGEQVRKEGCGSEGVPLDQLGFTCDSMFDCDSTTGFAGCAEGQFSVCQEDFGCKNNQFDCTDTEGGKNNTGEVYSCATFECSQTATGAGEYGFSCDEIDFMCGQAFVCSGGPLSFQCNSGHVFMCTNDHDCGRNVQSDGFSCNSTGYQGNGDYDEGSAGDFFCGWYNEGGNPQQSDFDCNMNFKCEGLSEFECGGMHGGPLPGGQGGGDFDCHSGDGEGAFNCGSGQPGQNFSCQNTTQFSQCQQGVDFFCAGPFEYSGTPDPS